ncbi:MAG: TonB-dependent receptor domain-containing protein [Acidobacteriota bacterium]
MRRLWLVSSLAIARLAHADPADDSGEVIEVTGTAPAPPPEPVHDTVAADELHELPGGGNDALRGLQSLPGVARIPFGLGGLALRGAAPHDTRVYLDDIPVPILYHFGGLASFLPIDAIDHLELTPSGAGAAYGGGIGGLVTIDSRSPHPTRWGAEGEISLLHAGVLATGPADGGGSWLVGVRRSYVDAVLAAAQVDMALAPSYLDGQVRWESADRKWLALAFASSDDLQLVHDPADAGGVVGISGAQVKSLDYSSRFLRFGVRYQHDGVTFTPWVGIDDIGASIDKSDADKGIARLDIMYGARGEIKREAVGGVLSVGGEVRATNYDYEIRNVPPPYPGNPMPTELVDRHNNLTGIDAGVYAEQTWQRGNVTVRPGVRLDYYGLADQVVIDPRLTVGERVGDAILTQSLGMYHESPLVTDLDPIFGERQLAPPQSIQASAAVEAPFADLFVGKATAYVQAQSQLPVDVVTGATPISQNGSERAGGLLAISRELVDEQFGSYTYRQYVGEGRSWGIELLARKELGRLTGWISYAYARAYRTGDPVYDASYYPYVLDQPHILTAVGSLPLGEHWRIGGRARLASGNPITPVAGSTYDPDKHQWNAVDGPLLSQRLPTFAQLDLRVDRIWRRRGGLWDLYLDVQNVTDRANVEGVTYSASYMTRYYTTGLPVFPSLGIEYRPR